MSLLWRPKLKSEPSGETVDVQETKTEAEESEPEIYHEVVVDANPNIWGCYFRGRISEINFRQPCDAAWGTRVRSI